MGKTIENLLLMSCRSPFLDNDKIYPPLGNLYLHQVILNHRPNTLVSIQDDYNFNEYNWLNKLVKFFLTRR